VTAVDQVPEHVLAAFDQGDVAHVAKPRFSSRAEFALVTEVDAGVDANESVTRTDVFEAFARNVERLQGLVIRTIALLPDVRVCACPTVLDGLRPRLRLPNRIGTAC
jgi:hypothetical protein